MYIYCKDDTSSRYMQLKRAFSHSRVFTDKESLSGEYLDFIDELNTKNVSYDIYDNKTDGGCTVFYDDCNIINAANDNKFILQLKSELKRRLDKLLGQYLYKYDIDIAQPEPYLLEVNIDSDLNNLTSREVISLSRAITKIARDYYNMAEVIDDNDGFSFMIYM